MKIAISSTKEDLGGEICDVFGRSPYFVIADVENGEIKKTGVIKNRSTDQTIQAGIIAARLMAENDVGAVIAGSVGPRALEVLEQFKIKAFAAEGKINDAIERFIGENLNELK